MEERYDTFAMIYDTIMDQELYEHWTDFSLRHFKSSTKTVLDLACGTGAQAVRFAKEGFEVTGLDLSFEMLEIAQNRAQEAGIMLELVQADMRQIAGVGTFDAITCYSDSLCYMPDEEALLEVFSGVYECLNSGGIFLYDVHSIYQVTEVFPDYSYHENAEDFAFIWDSYVGESPFSIEHDLTFFVKEGECQHFIRYDEQHKERTYSIETYQTLLMQAGFGEIEVVADFTDSPPIETSKRWFFKAVKT